MEKTLDQSILTVRVSSRSEKQLNKEYTLALQGYNNFFKVFPREEIRALFYDSLRQPTDTFRLEITNEKGCTVCAVVYNPDIELSDFFNMMESTVRDYYKCHNLELSKPTNPMGKIDWENGIPL